jgi:hypothetical protein
VPQGVLCEHVFHKNSWSWGVITHHCHRLHNIPVQSIPPRDVSPAASRPPRDLSPPRDGPPAAKLTVAGTDRRRLPLSGRPDGPPEFAGDEPAASPSSSSSQFCTASWAFSSSVCNPRRLRRQCNGGRRN